MRIIQSIKCFLAIVILTLLCYAPPARGSLQEAYDLLLEKDYENAAEIYLEILEKEQNAQAAFNLAYAYENLGKPEEALKYYNLAFEINPDLTEAALASARLYETLKQYSKALRIYENLYETADSAERSGLLAIIQKLKTQAAAEERLIQDSVISGRIIKIRELINDKKFDGAQEEIDGFTDEISELKEIKELKQEFTFEKLKYDFEQNYIKIKETGNKKLIADTIKNFEELRNYEKLTAAAYRNYADILIIYSKALIEDDEEDKARDYLNEVLNMQQSGILTAEENFKLYYALGLLYEKIRDYEKAIENYKSAYTWSAALQEHDFDFQEKIKSLTRRKNLNKYIIISVILLAAAAAFLIKKNIILKKVRSYIFYLIGNYYFSNQQWFLAKQYFKKFIELAGETDKLQRKMLLIYEKLNDKENAAQTALKLSGKAQDKQSGEIVLKNMLLLKKYDEAAAMLNKFIVNEPSRVKKINYYKQLITVLKTQKKEKEVIDAYERALSEKKDIEILKEYINYLAGLKNIQRSESVIKRYGLFQEVKEYSFLAEVYKKLYESAPESISVNKSLAYLYLRLYDEKSAIFHYEKILDKIVNKNEILRKLYPLYENQRQYSQASAVLDELIKQNIASLPEKLKAADFKFELKEYGKAAEYYFNVIDEEKDNALAYEKLMYIGRHFIYSEKYQEAKNLFLNLAKKVPLVKDELKYELGRCFFYLKNWEEAIKYFQKVTKGTVNLRYQAKNYIGISLVKSGYADLGVEQLEGIPINDIGVEPELKISVLYNKAQGYAALGDKEKAQKYLKQVILIDMNYKDALNLLKEFS